MSFDQIVSELFPAKVQTANPEAITNHPVRNGPLAFDDLPSNLRQRLSARMVNCELTGGRFPGLFDGMHSPNDDTSAGDHAMACELLQAGYSTVDVDLAFRASGRYRPKWDAPNGGSTYGWRTIDSARVAVPLPAVQIKAASPLSLGNGRFTIYMTPPPPRPWAIKDLLASSMLALLGGFGGSGKTVVVLHMACNVATGHKLFGQWTCEEGCSLLLLGEEDDNERNRRLSAIIITGGYNSAEQQLIQDRVRAFGLAGNDIRITVPVGSDIRPTAMVDEIISAANELAQETGVPCKLIVIDHARLAVGGDLNDAAHVTVATTALTRIAQETGAAVLVIAHSPKASANKEETSQNDIAGSGAFTANSRATLILTTMNSKEAKKLNITDEMRKQYVKLETPKMNYAADDQIMWLRKTVVEGYSTIVMVPIELTPPMKTLTSGGDERSIIEVVRAHKGRYSVRQFIERQGKKIGISQKNLAASIDGLKDAGKLIMRTPTIEERNQFGLSHNVKQVLDVGSGYD